MTPERTGKTPSPNALIWGSLEFPEKLKGLTLGKLVSHGKELENRNQSLTAVDHHVLRGTWGLRGLVWDLNHTACIILVRILNVRICEASKM